MLEVHMTWMTWTRHKSTPSAIFRAVCKNVVNSYFFRIMVPEKASSFNIHPERTCSDCCFFCRQKFGLFDTPLHISQMKSLEIQKFATEYSKCGKDGCLCDKCYRLVEREGRKAKRESEGEPRDSAPEKVRSCFVRNCNKEVKSVYYYIHVCWFYAK